MNKLSYLPLLAIGLGLVACDNSNNGLAPAGPPPETFKLQVLHASPDAPAVNVLIDGAQQLGGVDYKQGSAALQLDVGSYDIQVDGITPGGTATVIGPVNLTFDANTLYSIVAVNDVANIEPVILEQPDSDVPTGFARVRVLHAAPLAPQVDVHVSTPGAVLDGSTRIGTFSFKGDLGPVEVPAGDYQIRVTAPDAPGTVIFDSGTVALGDGNDLLVAAVENTTTGGVPISLALLTGSGSAEIANVNNPGDLKSPADIRVVHASPDTPAVDIVVNDSFGAPLVPGLTFPNFTDFVSVEPGDYNIKVTEPMSGLTPVDEDLTLDAGVKYTAVAIGTLAAMDIVALVAADDPRPVATEAKVRLIHASPTAGDVDIWITAPAPDLDVETPTLTAIPLGANTGFLSLAPGTYEVNIAPSGTTTAAISVEIAVAAGGIYTAIARDNTGGAGGLPLGLILLDDFT